MPTDDYDEIEEVDDYDDDIDEVDDDIEDVDEVDDDDEVEEEDKGRRQLRRGRLAEFSDKLSGGAARPGEESVKKSPFVMFMAGAIILLALVALIFFVMILTADEENSFKAAKQKLDAKAFPEARQRFEKFLEAYPGGKFENQARIALHKARVMTYTEASSYTVEAVVEGVKELEEFIRVCRDLEGFKDEEDSVRRYAIRLTRVGAIVAEAKKNQEALDQSATAKKIYEQYVGEKASISIDKELSELQRKAEAAILKDTKLNEALAEINGHLDAGDTFAALESRQALVDRYDALSDDADVTQILQNILDKEKELTVAESVGTEASTDELEAVGRVAASLTLRTQARTDLVSRDARVFAVGMGSCFGLDSETGAPLWKRSVGKNAPFAPTLVTPSQEDSPLLVFHSGVKELLLLNQRDGKLIWRQSIPEQPTGPPIIFQQQVYVTTASSIWRLSADSGKIISRVSFNQPVIGPPVLTRDQKHMVIPGDQSVIYTLTVNPMECVAVSYIEHRLGSVEAPMLMLGNLLLLCDNDTASETRLRVLDLDPATGLLTVRMRGQTTVKGQVRDNCLLRGTELFIPSTPQRVSAFNVNDSPEADPPLSPIGTNQLPTSSAASVFLLAGPQGQLWMASESLRKFRIRTNAVELLSDTAAKGLHLRPIQFKDRNVFVTTNEPYSKSVFYSKIDPQKMEGQWRTVLGTNVVAAAPTSNNQSLIAVGDYGHVYRVSLDEIKEGKFILDDISNHSLPDKLTDLVGGLELKDGRVASYCGGEEPAIWTFVPTGQFEQIWKLKGVPETEPVSLAAGVVAALPGRLQMTGVSGSLSVLDYSGPQGVNQQIRWKNLVAVSDRQVIAVSAEKPNRAFRIEYRTTPQPHLFEVSITPLNETVNQRPTLAGELLMACTEEKNLLALSSTTLEQLGSAALGGNSDSPPFVAGDRVFVDVEGLELKVFTRSAELQQTGSVSLVGGRSIVGTPVPVNDGFVVCFSDGQVAMLDADGNATEKTMSLGQRAQRGPVIVGNSLVVIGLDGSLFSIDDFLN